MLNHLWESLENEYVFPLSAFNLKQTWYGLDDLHGVTSTEYNYGSRKVVKAESSLVVFYKELSCDRQANSSKFPLRIEIFARPFPLESSLQYIEQLGRFGAASEE